MDQLQSTPVTPEISMQNIERLPTLQLALLNKFYRCHGSRMQISKPAEAWVMRQHSIIAGLCLTPVIGGYWLTGLFVAPEHRQRGVALNLIKHIQAAYPTASIWLFCHPDLITVYQRTNFQETQQLPESLNSRLARYQQHKILIAMHYTDSIE